MDTIEANNQIREKTRAAVSRFQQDRTSDTSSGGRTAIDESEARGIEQEPGELEDPGHGRFTKAGMLAAAAPGNGHVAKRVLATGGGREPVGWEGVDVPSKHRLWGPGIASSRRQAFKTLAIVLLLLSMWMWVCLSIFWGSTYQLEANFHRLTVNLVPLDTSSDSFLVQPMIQMAEMQNSLPASTPHFTWVIKQASDYPNGLEDVRREVLGQECWAAVVINANATEAWRTAIEAGDSSYNPDGAMGIYYQSARFYQVILLYVQQTITKNIKTPLSEARASAFQSFVSSVDAGAVSTAAQVPQALGVGFGYTIQDLRTIGSDQWAAAAPMEAALIYFIIFSFFFTLFQANGRMKSGLHKKLKFRSILILRLCWPIGTYFFLSLWFTVIEAIWQIPLQNYLGRGGGFPVLWMLNWATITAGGLALETMQALLGLAGLPLFLILWIILNISSSFYPIELMPTFYRFLYWMPFINNVEGFKIIAFGTNWNHVLGKHFGILLGTIGVELIIYPLCIWFERWRLDRGMIKAAREKNENGE